MIKTNTKFSDTEVLIWDFDGTFYPPNPALWKEIRQAEYRTIMNHTGWDFKQAVKKFNSIHKVAIKSATETVAYLTKSSLAQVSEEMETYFDRCKYLHRDSKLIELFYKLDKFQHYILANGEIDKIKLSLRKLGLTINIFQKIVTCQVVGVNKPNKKGFKYILEKTQLQVQKHMMIGDREDIDLAPAHDLGMKTCLVFATTPGVVADVTLSSVYDIASIF